MRPRASGEGADTRHALAEPVRTTISIGVAGRLRDAATELIHQGDLRSFAPSPPAATADGATPPA